MIVEIGESQPRFLAKGWQHFRKQKDNIQKCGNAHSKSDKMLKCKLQDNLVSKLSLKFIVLEIDLAVMDKFQFKIITQEGEVTWYSDFHHCLSLQGSAVQIALRHFCGFYSMSL